MKLVKYGVSLAIVGILGIGFYQKVYIPKHTFKTITPKQTDMSIKVNGVGNVGSENIYKISAIYGGAVSEFNLSIGQFVQKGELIAKIDSVDLKDKMDEIIANIKVIQANISSLKVDKQSAYKDYLYQEEVLKKNQNLFDKKAISELEYKKYLTSRDVAQLKIQSLAEKILSLQNQIPQLKASLAGLKAKLKRYNIYAKNSGYVTKKLISNHDVIGNNQPLVEIVDSKDVWIDTFIDTRISGNVKLKDRTVIKLRSGLKTDGYVYKISPINNAVTNEREIFVKFSKVPVPFYINEQATISIKIKTLNNVLMIPSKVVVFYNKKQGVWILRNGKAHFQEIEIKAQNGNGIATNITDEIIVPNPTKKPLSEGMKIYHD